jgi:hypothetical protein
MLQLALRLAPSLLLAALLVPSAAKPCAPSAQAVGDSRLSKGNVAMDIPGTRRVAVDRSGSCLEVDVSTPGTARLVALLLRSLDVPAEAVRFQVVS